METDNITRQSNLFRPAGAVRDNSHCFPSEDATGEMGAEKYDIYDAGDRVSFTDAARELVIIVSK